MGADLDLDDVVAQYPAAKAELRELKDALSALLDVVERTIETDSCIGGIQRAIQVAKRYEAQP